MTFVILVETLHNKVNLWRRILTLVSKSQFEVVFLMASEEEQKQVLGFIKDCELEEIKNWFKNIKLKQLGILSLRELRILASRFKIPNYTACSKTLLLSLIAEVKCDDSTCNAST